MSTGQEVTVGGLLITEYQAVKEEQRARIGFRDNLLYATLGSVAAVIAATISADDNLELLLLIPPVSVLLGWTYLANDEEISAIGRYIREELSPRLSSLTPAQEAPVFGWKLAHRGDSRRISRKWLQRAVDLVMFCVSPCAAVVVFWSADPVTAPLLVVSLAELAATAVLRVQIVLYADLKR